LNLKGRAEAYEYQTTDYIIQIQHSEAEWVKQLKVIVDNYLLLGEDLEVIDCPRCGFEMRHMQPCHMVCPNCGGHMDCSEKGLTW
jgi:peptide subunit release factor 1 (eRF1)